jgi:hypothetical protein
MPAPGRSHLSLSIAYAAVMVHLMCGAGEPVDCPNSSFLPAARANCADGLAASACRSKPLFPAVRARFARTLVLGSRAFTRIEATRLTTLPFGTAGRQLRFVHVETSRRTNAGRAPCPCVRCGRRAHGSGPFRTPRRAPPEDGYGDKRRSLLGPRPLCGKNVLPEPWPEPWPKPRPEPRPSAGQVQAKCRPSAGQVQATLRPLI